MQVAPHLHPGLAARRVAGVTEPWYNQPTKWLEILELED
jgi:hypothetical protein